MFVKLRVLLHILFERLVVEVDEGFSARFLVPVAAHARNESVGVCV